MLAENMKMIAECTEKLAHLGEKLFNETEMKYRAGDKVRIKSLDWYNENKVGGLVGFFTPSMKKLCGKVVTLDSAYNGKYTAIEKEAKGYYLDDSMIEGLAEEKKAMEEYESHKERQKRLYKGDKWSTEFECPDGYEFRDENGNVIEAKKIVLEKKKPMYPKTYEECCKVLGYSGNYNMILTTYVDNKLFNALYRIKVCRDAYWKIAGEEMGLGRPWEPDWEDVKSRKYVIVRGERGKIITGDTTSYARAFAFPTKEMRDAFYENFKELIEQCEELL